MKKLKQFKLHSYFMSFEKQEVPEIENLFSFILNLDIKIEYENDDLITE